MSNLYQQLIDTITWKQFIKMHNTVTSKTYINKARYLKTVTKNKKALTLIKKIEQLHSMNLQSHLNREGECFGGI